MRQYKPLHLLFVGILLSCSGGGDLNNPTGEGLPTTTPVEVTGTPTVSSTAPSSPAISRTPAVVGTSENNASVEIFSDSTCSIPVGTGTADASGNFSITITQKQAGGTTQSYFARATASGKSVSACSASSIVFKSTSIRSGLAWLNGTQTTAPTNPTEVNQATAFAIQWSASELDSDYYDHSTTTNSHEITVKQAGDYFVAATLPLTMTAGTFRPVTRLEVRVNGTLVPGAIGETSYIRFEPTFGNNQSSSHVAILIRNLGVSDKIEVFVQETAGEDGTETVSISNVASLFVEYIADSRDIFTANATRTVASTNLNQAGASPLEWVEGRKDASFTHNDVTNPEDITLAAGNYMVYVNIPVTSAVAVNRTGVKAQVNLGGVTVNGGQASQAYIRGDSNHFESSLHWSGLVTASAGQVLTIEALQDVFAGTVTIQAGTSSQITVERIGSTSGMISLRANALSGGTDWNPAAAQNILWATSDFKDASAYTHSTVTNQHQVTVTESGDYLLVYNDVLTSAIERASPIIKVQKNGVDLTGAETKTHYIRNQEGHAQSSASLVFLLRNLSAGDVITLTTRQNLQTGATNDLEDALLTIIKK